MAATRPVDMQESGRNRDMTCGGDDAAVAVTKAEHHYDSWYIGLRIELCASFKDRDRGIYQGSRPPCRRDGERDEWVVSAPVVLNGTWEEQYHEVPTQWVDNPGVV